MIETINHPKHYNIGKIEVIDFIEDQKLDFALGNAIKYIARAGHKEDGNIYKTINDLQKAIWYIQHKIDVLNEENSNAEKTNQDSYFRK